jgi:GR25 family glycosyltransferase involved in LPS biosynthesis
MTKEIFKVPVFYISFTRNTNTENIIQAAGFTNVQHFAALDGRLMDIHSMVLEGKIGSRAYADITNGREQHSGLPGMGAVGCTLSHMTLWQKCLDSEFDVTCIAEEDVKIPKPIPEYLQEEISTIMYSDVPSVYLSSTLRKNKHDHLAFGTQFYFVNKKACRELVKRVFPINEQTDFYICHLANIGLINLHGARFTSQSLHISSIQDFCWKCYNQLLLYAFTFTLIFVFMYWKCRK